MTIEVLDDSHLEAEVDLVKEWNDDWPTSSSSSVDWMGGKKLFWPLFWGYADADEDGTGQTEEEEDDYIVEYDSGETLPSGLGGDWEEPLTPAIIHYGEHSQNSKILLLGLSILYNADVLVPSVLSSYTYMAH